MRHKKTIGIVVSLLLASVVLFMCTFFVGLSVRAQQVLAPRADSVHALWVVGSDAIVKVASADGTVMFTLPGAQDVRAVAVDARRGVLWAYGAHTLQAYSFSGTFVLSVPLPPLDEDDAHTALAVNADDGTVHCQRWAGGRVARDRQRPAPDGSCRPTALHCAAVCGP